MLLVDHLHEPMTSCAPDTIIYRSLVTSYYTDINREMMKHHVQGPDHK